MSLDRFILRNMDLVMGCLIGATLFCVVAGLALTYIKYAYGS